MTTRKVSVNQLDEVIKDTKTIRARLNKHKHFVYLGKDAIAQLFVEELGGYVQEEVDRAYSTLLNQLANLPSIDISSDKLITASNLINDNRSTVAVRILKQGDLLGVLTSNFDNARKQAVNIVQKIIGIELAVGHQVGKAYETTNATGFKYIHNNVIFRSPLSIKLAVVSEAYSIYDLVTTDNWDTLINTYFEPSEGAKYKVKNTFKFFIEALGNVFGSPFMRAIEADAVTTTSIKPAFKGFTTTYFNSKYKNKAFLASNLNSSKIAQVRQEVLNAINGIADAHTEYFNKVVSESTITKSFSKELTELRIVFTIPQTERFNSSYLATIESSFSRAALKFIKEQAPGFISSPSLIDYTLDAIENTILGKGTKPFNQVVKATEDTLQKSSGTAITGVSINKQSKVTKVTSVLRAITGRFTSVINIEALIRARLRDTVIKNMKAPALVNRTGRFANSVKLDHVENRQGEVVAFLSYMKYPYATFEPGNRQGSAARSPSALIDKSVREIAKSIITNRLKTVIV